MASGVATTIHFMYPVPYHVNHDALFKEKKSGWRIAAIASAVAGVYFLSGGDTKTGAFSFLGLFIVLLSALRICALSRHNEPIKNWTDERATAYFLCIPIRRYSPFYRNRNHQPASTHQRMAYCRQLDSISFNPYRSF